VAGNSTGVRVRERLSRSGGFVGVIPATTILVSSVATVGNGVALKDGSSVKEPEHHLMVSIPFTGSRACKLVLVAVLSGNMEIATNGPSLSYD